MSVNKGVVFSFYYFLGFFRQMGIESIEASNIFSSFRKTVVYTLVPKGAFSFVSRGLDDRLDGLSWLYIYTVFVIV